MTSRPCRRATPARPFREQIAFSGQFLEILSGKRDLLLPQIAFSGQKRRLLSGKSDLWLLVTTLMRCGPMGSLECTPLGRPQNRSQRVDRLCWTAASAYGSLPACPARLDAVDSPLTRIALCVPRSAAGSRPGRPLPARSSGPRLVLVRSKDVTRTSCRQLSAAPGRSSATAAREPARVRPASGPPRSGCTRASRSARRPARRLLRCSRCRERGTRAAGPRLA